MCFFDVFYICILLFYFSFILLVFRFLILVIQLQLIYLSYLPRQHLYIYNYFFLSNLCIIVYSDQM